MSPARTHAPELAIAGALGVLSMGFQLVASRILSPHFGSSIVVWAWLISTFLAAFTVGSLTGGWLVAGSPARRAKAVWIAVVAAMLLLFDAVAGPPVTAALAARFGAAGLPVACLLLFLPPITALSVTTPVLVARAAERGLSAGVAAGLFAGASTAGNIAGVMITAFILIPVFGSTALLRLWALGGSLILAVLTVRLARGNRPLRPALALVTIAGIAMFCLVHYRVPVPTVVSADVPLTVDSVYNHLVIERSGSVVSLRRTDHGNIISAVDLADPQRQVVPVIAYFFAGALVNPQPRHALQIGLGGGAFNQLFIAAWPDATLTSVEIDPAVRDIAMAHMGYKPSNRDVVEIGDGRRYLASHPGPYDWIVLDAFIHGGQVQPHLRTLEFYRAIREALAPGGVMIDNLQRSQALYASDVATLHAAFPQVLFLAVPHSANVVAIVGKDDPGFPPLAERLAKADPATLPQPLRDHLDFAEMRSALIPSNSLLIRLPGKVLTDDFAPAEYLDAMPAR